MTIDVHHHLVCERGYLDGLLREMDSLGIEKTGLIAMGPLFERLFVTTPETCGPLDENDVLKAVRDMFVEGTGAPSVRLLGKAARYADSQSVRRILISLSHTRSYAVAQALILGDVA